MNTLFGKNVHMKTINYVLRWLRFTLTDGKNNLSVLHKCSNGNRLNIRCVKIKNVSDIHKQRSIRQVLNYTTSNDEMHNDLSKSIIYAFALGIIIVECKRQTSENSKFFNTVRLGHPKELKRLIKEEKINVNQKHLLGWTALHLAAVNGKLENLKVLIEAGADLNAGDEYINNFRTATEKGFNTYEVLLQRETEFSSSLRAQENYLGFTALHYAVLTENTACVKALIAAGANPLIEASGYKPLDLARNQREIESTLREYCEKFEEIEKERQAEERRKFPLEQRLKQYIVGQEAAISIVASTIRRKENGWADDEHPLVFLFLGSSGIGKTELAKQLARYIHKDNPKAFIRLDMSEYQEKHEVAKLIGAPPGYVGHDAGGQLTKKLKACPNAVVLLDEVDKAHPDVLTVLLQLFDEGRLTDGKGKTIECKNAIFVMTSNLASDEIAGHAMQLRSDLKRLKNNSAKEIAAAEEELTETVTISRSFKDNVVRPILKKHFGRDEFLGRINEIVYFLPFSNPELNKLVSKELNFWALKAKEKHSISLNWETGVETVLAGGYNMHYGARSIKYEVERRVVSKLAAAQEAGLLKAGSSVYLMVHWPSDSQSGLEPTIRLQLKHKGMKNFIDVDSTTPVKNVNNNISFIKRINLF